MHNHMCEIWACDFLEPYYLSFRALLGLIIIELVSRRVLCAAATRNPSDAWWPNNCAVLRQSAKGHCS